MAQYKYKQLEYQNLMWEGILKIILICKDPQQNTSEPNLATYRKDFTPWLSDIYPRNAKLIYYSKSISIIQHISRIKGKNYTIISTDTRKAFNKIQHIFKLKTINKLGLEGNVLNLIKGIYDKAIANNIMVKDWMLSP